MLLAGDIGGTKTALAVFSPEAGPRVPHAQAEFPSARYPNLEAIVRTFVAQTTLPVDQACFAVAGPVIAERAKITNLPWVIDAATLRQELRLGAVALLNDLEAIAWAVPILQPDDLRTLNRGEASPGGTIAVIAPGTGLGEAFLTWDGTGYRAHASEGGHTDFAPMDATQVGLLQYLLQRSDHVSYEHVCSGIGLPNIYAYLRDSGAAPEAPALAARLARPGGCWLPAGRVTMEQRCLLAAFAHPDDEAFGTAGVFRKYRDEGARTALVCATRGEEGEISDPGLATPETLGQVREQELRE